MIVFQWLLIVFVLLFFCFLGDLFSKKIQRKSIRVCFSEYNGSDTYQDSIDFIREKFKAQNHLKFKQIYIHITCATDKNNVKKVFDDVQHGVVMRALSDNGLI